MCSHLSVPAEKESIASFNSAAILLHRSLDTSKNEPPLQLSVKLVAVLLSRGSIFSAAIAEITAADCEQVSVSRSPKCE